MSVAITIPCDIKSSRDAKAAQIIAGVGTACLVLLLSASLAKSQVTDPTGIKRAFLDRYLDCAEAPNDATRLDCYDALLLDIPAWLDDATDQPLFSSPTWIDRAIQTSDTHEGCEGRGTTD